MPARGYEFYPQAGILFIIHTPMARCCDALFLLAETEVAMKTVITSQVKKKHCVFTGYQIFVSGKILVFHRCLYNIYTFLEVCLKRVRGAGVIGMRGMKKREH